MLEPTYLTLDGWPGGMRKQQGVMSRRQLSCSLEEIASCRGKPATAGTIGKDWFDGFLKELTDSFGGATNFLRAPGPVAEQRRTEKNSIAMVEAMVEEIDGSYRHSRRERLERKVFQDEIVIRAEEIRRL